MSTLRQKIVASKIFANRGSKDTVKKIMKDAGYSDAYAKNPQQLTTTRSWRQLMDKYLPDEKIVKKIDEGLEANRVISAVNTAKQASGGTTDFIEVPDFAIRHKYVETSLKIKGKLDTEKEETPSLVFNLYGLKLRPTNQSSA